MKIKEIQLFTSNISGQKEFYDEVLGLEQLSDSSEKISFKIGESVLTFLYKEQFKPSHLAFNIPPFSEDQALGWLKNRVDVLNFEGQEISDFINWNAKAIYFYDADKNIMEFIARRNLKGSGRPEFSPVDLLSISEMAIASENIETIYNKINAIKPIAVFDGTFDRFCAIGNDEGLFILINKSKKKWYPTQEVALMSDFIIKGDYNFSFIDGELKELV